MQKKVLALLLLFLGVICTKSEERRPVDQLSFDSILHEVSRNDLTLDEKYNLFYLSEHLSITEQINIKKAIAKYVLDATDKDKFITLNCMINNHFNAISLPDSGKKYLDQALRYTDSTENVDALGALYYQLGNYYFSISDEDRAHENYYKAISFYEQSKTKKFVLNFLYYRIGAAYLEKEDMESLEPLVKRMLAIEFEDPNKIYYNNIYSFVGTYYEEKAKKDSAYFRVYLDSSLYYRRKSVEIYERYKEEAPNPLGARRMASQNYWEIAATLLKLDPEDLDPVLYNVAKGELYMDKNHLSSQIKYYGIKTDILLRQHNYKEALDLLKTAETLLGNKKYNKSDSELFNLYGKLSYTYEQLGDYRNALEYARLKEEVYTRINDSERYQIIKNLNVKYETAEKELEISRLNEEQQQMKLRRIKLLISFAVILILLLTALLSMRWKKMKKEKEAALMAKRVEEKKVEYQTLLNVTEQRQMRRYLDGLETERSRLAKELHDNVSNELLAVKMQVEAECDMQQVVDSLAQLHMEVRTISHGLMPPVFNYVTLPDIIKDYERQLTQKTAINLSVTIESGDYNWEHFPSDLSVEIYRIMQELVGNAIKHAKASQIKIMVILKDNCFLMEITDNGLGFDTLANYTGVGLRIIKERAELIKAHLEIESGLGSGTNIRLRLDLSNH